jgi:hypothetical protein
VSHKKQCTIHSVNTKLHLVFFLHHRESDALRVGYLQVVSDRAICYRTIILVDYRIKWNDFLVSNFKGHKLEQGSAYYSVFLYVVLDVSALDHRPPIVCEKETIPAHFSLAVPKTGTG